MVRAIRSMRLDDAVDEEFVVVPVVIVVVTVAMGNNDEDDGEEKLLFRLVSSALQTLIYWNASPQMMHSHRLKSHDAIHRSSCIMRALPLPLP
jgi:hypothetical protein